jgi:hypothetical protein
LHCGAISRLLFRFTIGASGVLYFVLFIFCTFAPETTRATKRPYRLSGEKMGRTLNNGHKNLYDIMRNKGQHFYWSSIILVLLGGGIGCSKPQESINANPISYVTIMNLAPYGGPVDIYFNGTQVSPAGGILPGQFSTEYGQLKPGNYTVDFKVTGTDSLLYELPASQFDTSGFYTLVLYNAAPGSPAVQAARILDNFSQVNTLSAYYRFFNMSPDASSVSLYMNGTVAQAGRSPADNVASQVYDQFQALSGGDYTLQVQNSTTDSVLATQTSYPFASGSIYTIFLTGTSKGGMKINVLPVAY